MSATKTRNDEPLDLTRNLPEEVDITGVDVNEGLSDETLAFSATLLLDGEEAGTVSNRGSGGPNRYDVPRETLKRLEAIAEEWLKQEHNQKAAEPLDLLVSHLLEEKELREIASRNPDRPVAIEALSGWRAWDDTADPGDLLGGMFTERKCFAVPASFDVEHVAADAGAEAYRVVRAD